MDLSNNQLCGLEPWTGRGAYVAKGATALADALRINGGLTSVSLLGNNFNKKAAQMLLQIKAEKPKEAAAERRMMKEYLVKEQKKG